LLLGGGSAYAATEIAKSSIGNDQLKKNAVSTGKIKDGAVTGPKINLSSLGTVPSATHATSADSAMRADSATTATSAVTATRADIATSANTATRADSLVAPEGVHFVGTAGEPPFENGFGNKFLGSGPAGFYMDRQCVVHLVGQVEGTSANTAYTLPAADRPPQEVFAGIAAAGPKAANVQVQPSGIVSPAQAGGGTGDFGLDGVTFRAATC
jgi:hypothetical protein